MNEDAVKILLAQLGIAIPAERAAAIAAELAITSSRLARAPRPAFEDEPASFQAQTQTGAPR